MRNQTQQGILVGFFFLLALAISFGAYLFLRGRLGGDKRITVVFADARGIKEGEPIQMSGVDIGQVESVDLRPSDNQAAVVVRIRQERRIPVGSRFHIKSGLLGNSRVLSVEPNQNGGGEIKDGDVVVGDSDAPLDETLAETKKLVIQGQELVKSFQTISGHLETITGNRRNMRSLETTLANTAAITENLKEVTAQLPQLKGQVDLLIADLRGTLGSGRRIARGAEGLTGNLTKLAGDARGIARDVGKLTRDLDATLLENRESIKNTLAGLEEASGAVATILTDLKTTVTDSGIKDKLAAATDNLVIISGRLDAAATDLQRLTGDPRLASDLRDTLGNVRETSESIRNLAKRLEALRIPGERRNPDAGTTTGPPSPRRPASATSLVEPGFVFDSTYDTTLERLRVDANYTLLSGRRGSFYRLGLADVTESNMLNAQIGRASGDPMTFGYRYGLFAGKLGVGADTRLGPFDLRVDLYDPNRFQADARVKTYLNSNTALTFGIGSIGKENRATLGVQIRR
jgi:phospholipid/cholesterol/gamma-HCH transport system substrate-binding protein